jgi:hypothetical protein
MYEEDSFVVQNTPSPKISGNNRNDRIKTDYFVVKKSLLPEKNIGERRKPL